MPGTLGWCDTVYAVPVVGDDRGHLRPFLSVPVGAEVTGPAWGPDDETLFVSVQHPGEGGVLGSLSQWPDFAGGLPRPSVVATRREDGEPIRLG
jgi:secreted PhoX family phosphatase